MKLGDSREPTPLTTLVLELLLAGIFAVVLGALVLLLDWLLPKGF